MDTLVDEHVDGQLDAQVDTVRLRCSDCGTPADDLAWRCAECGGVLDLYGGVVDRRLDPAVLPAPRPDGHANQGLWRFRSWIPVAGQLSLGEPITPIVSVDWDGLSLALKLEGALPTGSFKDRGSAVLVDWLVRHGATHAVVDSSGNAGASLAAYSTRAGLPCHIFAPDNASPGKLSQIAAYGAHLHRVPGNRDEVTDAAVAWAANGVYASHAWNPLFVAGMHTFAYEVWEQFGGDLPDAIVLPVGAGTLLLGAARGFAALADAGLVRSTPRIYGIQSMECAPLATAWNRGDSVPAEVALGDTAAEGIRISRPPRGRQIIAAVRATGGALVAVSDDALWTARADLAAQGVYAEVTSAIALAGVRTLAATAQLNPDDQVLVAISASGLKTPTGK